MVEPSTQSHFAVLPKAVCQFRVYLRPPVPLDLSLIALAPGLEGAAPKRQMQFRAGRYCAMEAMGALNDSYAGRQIGRTATGAPLWPEGVIGSITHTDDFASAAVALTADAAAIGIDTERIMPESTARTIADTIASPVEVAHARAAGFSQAAALTLVFSAKESIFKCLHPMVARYFDFHSVRIVDVDGDNRTFAAQTVETLSNAFPADTILRGRFAVEAPWIHTGIALATSSHSDHGLLV